MRWHYKYGVIFRDKDFDHIDLVPTEKCIHGTKTLTSDEYTQFLSKAIRKYSGMKGRV